MTMALIGSGAATAVAVILLALGEYRFVQELRRQHPVTWQNIGSPSPWFSRLQDVTAVSRFLSRRGYEHLDDPALAILGHRLRILTSIVYGFVAATLLLLMLARLAARAH